PERRIEGVPDALVLERHVPEIIRIVDLESGCGAVTAPEIFAPHGHSPDANEKVLVPLKMRRPVREIRTEEPAPAPLQRIARRAHESHRRFPEYVLPDANDRH